MIWFKRINFIFSVFLTFILLEILAWRVSLILGVILGSSLIILFSVWRIIPKSISIRKELAQEKSFFYKFKKIIKLSSENKNYIFFIAPLILFLGSVAFVLLQSNPWIIHLMIILFCFFYFLFLESLFFYFYPDSLKVRESLEKFGSLKEYFLENIFTVINLVSLFLIYSACFSLSPLFNFSVIFIISLIVIFTFLSNIQLFFIYQIPKNTNYLYNIIITIIIVEIFWAIMFLPISFYVNGLTLAVVYYALVGTIYFHVKGTLDKVKIIRHLTVSCVVIILAIATARWV